MRQVSPESIGIFDYILDLSRHCQGDWNRLASEAGVDRDELSRFLDFAAVFLSNVGNYYGSGDHKFIPDVSKDFLERLARCLPYDAGNYADLHDQILSRAPASLGLPKETAQSSYYIGDVITTADLDVISENLSKSILPENTRIRKTESTDGVTFDVLIASIESSGETLEAYKSNATTQIRIQKGDHSVELRQICDNLLKARAYASNDLQTEYLSLLVNSFESGDLETYRESIKSWLKDRRPPIETIFGFVEPYRDPYGIRAEFEGIVAIVDETETARLTALSTQAPKFVKRLPWCGEDLGNDGKGPFEKEIFDDADFTSLHTVAYCSSIVLAGINLPNYNDLRQTAGSKSMMIANSLMQAVPFSDADCIPDEEKETFLKQKSETFYLWVVLHELLGHGTGKLLMEESPGVYNFNHDDLPINPITQAKISIWYKPGQTWTGVFGDLATTVDECRAECVGAYLMSDWELLGMFGYGEKSTTTCKDLEFNMYQQLGVAGLNALKSYNAQEGKWGQAHARAHLAMLRVLLGAGDDFMTVEHDKESMELTVRVARSKIRSHGRPAIERLLLRLHMFRCTGDIDSCRKFYEPLTELDEELLSWRRTMIWNSPSSEISVQPNTIVEGDNVVLRDYEASSEGVIASWVDRNV